MTLVISSIEKYHKNGHLEIFIYLRLKFSEVNSTGITVIKGFRGRKDICYALSTGLSIKNITYIIIIVVRLIRKLIKYIFMLFTA